MAKLVNIFADDTVRALAISIVHQNEKERDRTRRKIRAHLLLTPERLVIKDLRQRRNRLRGK